MSAKYEIGVTPASKFDFATFNNMEAEFHELRHNGKAAVFGQIHVDNFVPIMKAHVFTGDAMLYLHKCVKRAVKMQAKQDVPQSTGDSEL